MPQQWNPIRLTVSERPSRRFAALALLLYAAMTLFVTLHHEPYADEADSWLLVRDASFSTILARTRDAGSPALWYLLLKPLIWLKMPYVSQSLLHLVFAWIGAALLLLEGPFSRLTTLLLLGSYYLSYEYAVIARSYVLTVVLVFVIVCWSPQREIHPIRYAIAVALLFNANVHGGAMAASLLGLYSLERRRSAGALAIMLAGAFAAYLQMIPSSEAAYPLFRGINSENLALSLGSAFLPGLSLTWGIPVAIALLAVITATLAHAHRRDAVAFLWLSAAGLMFISVFIWFSGYRHAGMLFLVVLGAIWMAGDIAPGRLTAAAALLLNGSLLFSLYFAVQMARADIRWNFSGSKEMGEYIRDHRLDRYPIAAHNIHQCEAVLPYLDRKFVWYAGAERFGTYTHIDRAEKSGIALPYSVATARAIEKFAPTEQPWLLLLNTAMPRPESHGFRLLYATHGVVYRKPDERYWLYQWIGPPKRTL